MKNNIIFVFVIVLFVFIACNKNEIEQTDKSTVGTLVQVSVIDALLQGIYDGYYPIGDLLHYGNYGIGTFNALDGEMIVFNDTVFQVVSSGEVNLPEANVLTPFAAVTTLNVDTTFTFSGISFEQIKADFDKYFPTPNVFYVIKLKGNFTKMHTRSVPKQEKPYRPLVEVTANQPEFEFENIFDSVLELTLQ